MSTFSVSIIEPLEYDFTKIRSNSGSGYCKGKGIIPEPSQTALEAYGAAVRELYKVDESKDVTAAMDADERQAHSDAEAKERSDTLLALTSGLCQNQPSDEQLKDLPPRYCRAFMKWIFAELQDPKVLTEGTQN